MAKIFLAFYQDKVMVNKNAKKNAANIQPSSPVLTQVANQSGYRIHFILSPRRFSHDVLHTEVQYCSKVSWESLKSQSSTIKSQISMIKDRIEFQISSREILWTCQEHILKIMYRSLRLVCFRLNEAHALKAKKLRLWSLVKSLFETCFFFFYSNMYIRYCNSGENWASDWKYM